MKATKPLRTAFFVLFPTMVVWCSFVFSDYFLQLKVESQIKEFVSNPYYEYSVFRDGKYQDPKPIIQSFQRLSTKSINRTFPSRTKERSFRITRGSTSFTLSVFDSSDKETFYWVVYIVPGTNYKYIGRIRINEVN